MGGALGGKGAPSISIPPRREVMNEAGHLLVTPLLNHSMDEGPR